MVKPIRYITKHSWASDTNWKTQAVLQCCLTYTLLILEGLSLKILEEIKTQPGDKRFLRSNVQAQNYRSHNPVYELNVIRRPDNHYKHFFLLHSGNMSHLLLECFYPQDGSSVCMVTTSCNIQLESYSTVIFFHFTADMLFCLMKN